MDLKAVYKKTQKGLEEMAHRTVLGMRERTLLVMVDGKTTAAELLARAKHMPDPEALLTKLIEGEFIKVDVPAVPTQPVAAAPQPSMKVAVAFAREFLYNSLGPNADPLVVALEKCKSLPELRARLEETRDTFGQIGRQKKGEEFWAGVEPLLPQG